MDTINFLDIDCVPLENASLCLLLARSVGPRIISLRLKGGENLFAELPDLLVACPDGKEFRFYGGHRIWHAPENMPRTYIPDDEPVEITPRDNGLLITRMVEVETGIEKSIHVSLVGDKPQVMLRHTLTNRGMWPVECAPWAITQLKPGGVAILPQSQGEAMLLPNRSLAIWPYTDITSPHVCWGNNYILLHAEMQVGAFKIGFPNPRGWLAYWVQGTLFVKRAACDLQAVYYDFGSSSECYCNEHFLELETLAPISKLAPVESVMHLETWELYPNVDYPENEEVVQAMVENLGLE